MNKLLDSTKSYSAKIRCRSRMQRHEYNGRWYEVGAIATAWGFVSAYRQEDLYDMSFIWNGTEYYHSKRESISEAALVRRAAKFANEIVGSRVMRGDRT